MRFFVLIKHLFVAFFIIIQMEKLYLLFSLLNNKIILAKFLSFLGLGQNGLFQIILVIK